MVTSARSLMLQNPETKWRQLMVLKCLWSPKYRRSIAPRFRVVDTSSNWFQMKIWYLSDISPTTRSLSDYACKDDDDDELNVKARLQSLLIQLYYAFGNQ